MEVTFVIPALNEAEGLPGTLARLSDFLAGADVARWRAVVVDDGSTDGTAEAVEAAADEGGLAGDVTVVRHERNLGKGAAARTGVLEAALQIAGTPNRVSGCRSAPLERAGLVEHVIVITDADGNYLSNRARPYLDAVRDGADVVLASRAHAGSVWRVSRTSCRYIHRRRAISRIFCEVVRRLFGMSLGDTQTGLKFFRASAARELFERLVTRGFAYDVEVLCRARRRGLVVRELPLVYCCPSTESKVGVWEPLRMAWDLLRIRRICRDERAG